MNNIFAITTHHEKPVDAAEAWERNGVWRGLRVKSFTVTLTLSSLAPWRMCRVEDWRGVPKVKPICYRPFRLTVPH